ncbi:hypothetical protein CL656_06195 [bacterium]|nr:hypothetical protein [bacterium]|tara:strand:- start:2455 stop:3162 length:708 start_codon:yes stop_codon:yes gene_type:complete
MTETFINQKCIKRILQDLKNIDSKLLNENNIYYYHDEENILKGYIMIIGPSDSLYEDGYYFFEINFTNNYPFEPPKVIFRTQDGLTRFHPNLYKNGKVCLSLLNTWKGESWSSCQTLSTVLLTLVTLFTNEPFLNEPGVQKTYKDYNDYHNIIYYKNIDHSIASYIDSNNILDEFKVFYPIIIEKFKEKQSDIIQRCIKKSEENVKKMNTVNIYNMFTNIDYKNLIKKISEIKIE